MKLQAVKEVFHKELSPIYPREEINSFFHHLVEHYLGMDRFVLILDPQYTISHEQEQPLFEALSLLKDEYPLQYIMGEAEFMGLRIKVNENVLIPRPETEELVRWILESHETVKGTADILDLGTGSGCIAIALAKFLPGARVHALDVSKKALAVCEENAKANGVQLSLFHWDILGNSPLKGSYDIMVSNPPYVRQSEAAAIRNNVKRYEPSAALFVEDEDPLLFYRKIGELARATLRPRGWLYFEINQYLGNDMAELMQALNFSNIELRRDFFGNDRIIRGQVGSSNSRNTAH